MKDNYTVKPQMHIITEVDSITEAKALLETLTKLSETHEISFTIEKKRLHSDSVKRRCY